MDKLINNISLEGERRPHLLPVVLVAAVGFVISCALFTTTSGWVDEKRSSAFASMVSDRISALNSRLKYEVEELDAIVAFYQSSQHVSVEEFRQFIDHMIDDKESTQMFGWAPRITNEQRPTFEQSVRESGLTGIRITEAQRGAMVNAPERSDYVPVNYMAPIYRYQKVLGYDLASERIRRHALQSAERDRQSRATSVVELLPGMSETRGILVFAPVFQGDKAMPSGERLSGFVVGFYEPEEILEISLSNLKPAGIDIHLYDITTADQPELLAYHSSRIQTRDGSSAYHDRQRLLTTASLSYAKQFTVAGRTWEVIATPAATFIVAQELWWPQIVLAFGVLLTVTVVFLLYITVRHAEKQKRFAEEAIAAKDALQKSEQMLREAQCMAKVGNWYWDIESNHLAWSDEIYRIFGLQPQQFGASYEAFLAAVHPDDMEMVNHATMAAIEHGTHYSIDHRIVLPDGSERFVHEEGSATFENGKAVRMMGTVQDITEQRGLEDQLRHAQKMEAIGTLVGGIAHDFNNTLAAIQGNVYLARRASEGNEVVLDKLNAVEKMGGRAADMIKKLLTFARKDAVRIVTFSMNELVEETVMLARRGFAEDVEIRSEISDQNLPVGGDVSLLEQVILNLLNNAYDAVSQVESPMISCSLQHYQADQFLRIRHPELEGDAFALLVIRDNGYGIPEKNLKNIFEPFFTTKEVGKGTGLGLSMAYGAIHNHGGVIEVSSKQGEGCEFKIYLPICSETGVSTGDELIDGVVRGEGETILLADDHHDMRKSSAEVLSELGYQVIEAVDGEQAVELFNANRERLDIIISDVVMPKMSGIDAVRHIRALGGDLPVVFVSGYSEEKTGLVDGTLANSRLLAKPYDVGELSQLLRHLIEAEKT